VGKECKIPKTQEALPSSNLLSLPHLPAKRTNGREPLVDYSQSHVVILEEYLTIIQQKVLDREVAQLIRETRRKKKQNK
jgi:hypothetical protein